MFKVKDGTLPNARGAAWTLSGEEQLQLRILIAAHTGMVSHSGWRTTRAAVETYLIWKDHWSRPEGQRPEGRPEPRQVPGHRCHTITGAVPRAEGPRECRTHGKWLNTGATRSPEPSPGPKARHKAGSEAGGSGLDECKALTGPLVCLY